MAFYGFLLASEFTGPSLQWSDIAVEHQHFSVIIRESKIDPFRKGHTLHISPTGTSTCLVRAVQKYLAMVPEDLHHGPLFLEGQFSPLTRDKLYSILRHLWQQAGHNHYLYYTHSFRIGAATTVA